MAPHTVGFDTGLLPGTVLTTSEAREQAPAIAKAFREAGTAGQIVYFGAHRRPDAAIVPTALLALLAPLLEDLLIAEQIRTRDAEDDGTRFTLEGVDARHGFTADEIAAEVDALSKMDAHAART